MTPRAARLVALGFAAAATGCRNPFVASADIEFSEFSPPEIAVMRTATQNERNGNWYQARNTNAWFISKNKVGAQITSITYVYTDLAGNLVTSYRTTGGRTNKILARIRPRFDKGTLGYGKGDLISIQIYPVDSNVYDELAAQVGSTRTVVAHVTLRGEDDEGNDVSFSGDVTIKGFGF